VTGGVRCEPQSNNNIRIQTCEAAGTITKDPSDEEWAKDLGVKDPNICRVRPWTHSNRRMR